LEQCHEGCEKRAFAYSEEEMRLYAEHAAAKQEAAKLRKPPRRPVPGRHGAFGRNPSAPTGRD
jgi:hypothetical protein